MIEETSVTRTSTIGVAVIIVVITFIVELMHSRNNVVGNLLKLMLKVGLKPRPVLMLELKPIIVINDIIASY